MQCDQNSQVLRTQAPTPFLDLGVWLPPAPTIVRVNNQGPAESPSCGDLLTVPSFGQGPPFLPLPKMFYLFLGHPPPSMPPLLPICSQASPLHFCGNTEVISVERGQKEGK